MPVIDTPSHPSTIHNDMRYTACQNKVRRSGYFVLTREYKPTGEYELRPEFIENTSSRGCRNVSPEPACQGCEFPKDLEYINRMKAI